MSSKLADARMRAIFNWKAEAQTCAFGLPEAGYITDYWSGESLDGMKTHAGEMNKRRSFPHVLR